MSLIPLVNAIRQCDVCKAHLPFPPQPVVQLHESATLLIIGQAPGLKVEQTGIPWNDASGNRLRTWLNQSTEDFYNKQKTAIMPMGFCYPGKGKSGDLPPRTECAPLWHEQILNALPNIKHILLIGNYAQQYYLKHSDYLRRYPTLTERVKHFEATPKPYICLPHPSPRNQYWMKKHPWFEQTVVPYLQQVIS